MTPTETPVRTLRTAILGVGAITHEHAGPIASPPDGAAAPRAAVTEPVS